MRCYEDPIPNKQTQGAKQRKIGEIAHRDHVGCWRAFGFQSRQRFRMRGRNRFWQTDRREDAFCLSLSADQKTKMDAVMVEHEKTGCSEASEAKYMKEAKGILTKKQYAKFKAECKGEKDKTNA